MIFIIYILFIIWFIIKLDIVMQGSCLWYHFLFHFLFILIAPNDFDLLCKNVQFVFFEAIINDYTKLGSYLRTYM